jgi:hypothetical protein
MPIRRIGFGFKGGSGGNFLNICDVIEYSGRFFHEKRMRGAARPAPKLARTV